MKTNNEYQNLDQLVTKLKKEDSKYAAIIKAFQIIYWIFILVFALLTILDYFNEKNQNELIGDFCFILSFLIIALFFRRYHKEYKYVDYSLPTVQMLKKAVWRYQPFQKETVWILFGLGIMDIGLTFDWINKIPVVITQTFFIGLTAIGFIIGLIIWKYKYKSLRDDAKSLIREIED